MKTIKIINPGFLTTIQDKGRKGFEQYGISNSGAMDIYSMELANILVGNKREEAVLEATIQGPTIEFKSSICFAITGAYMNPTLNNRPIAMYEAIEANEGDILHLSNAINAVRSYIAFRGEFNIPDIMNSKSTYLKAGFGGFKGRKILREDIIEIKEKENYSNKINIPKYIIPNFNNLATIRVILGPEEECFTKAGRDAFLNNEYIITENCDRMGYRLEGERIDYIQTDIISNGINRGAIQVSGNGQPIIMMSDRQTTGGYAKIANVISVDMDVLAQMKTGDKIRFKEITVSHAQRLYKEREDKIRKLINPNEKTYIFNINGVKYKVSIEEIINNK